jgi:hypothetical protein
MPSLSAKQEAYKNEFFGILYCLLSEIARRFKDVASLTTLMMETSSHFEASLRFTALLRSTSQKTVIFIFVAGYFCAQGDVFSLRTLGIVSLTSS